MSQNITFLESPSKTQSCLFSTQSSLSVLVLFSALLCLKGKILSVLIITWPSGSKLCYGNMIILNCQQMYIHIHEHVLI